MTMTGTNPANRQSGILNVRKPVGMSSHDVVARVRRLIGTKRVGHAGTLDPAADGVLLVCVGAATRVSEYLMECTKRYRAVIRLGATSATDDSEGPITPASPPDRIDRERLADAMTGFVGDVDQIPPRFAAIKVAGRKLYDRARAGEVFTPASRRVRIEAIDLIDWQSPDVTVEVTCSKGTYIRSIARDLGETLGTGGYLLALTRTASGTFALDTSHTLDDIARAVERHDLSELLQPLDRAVATWPVVILPDVDARRVANGGSWNGVTATESPRARAYDRAGNLVALLERDEEIVAWRPTKVFYGDAAHGAA